MNFIHTFALNTNENNMQNRTDINESVFSPEMKLGEMIDVNYRLLSILSRLDVRLGFGEMSVEEMCRRRNMSPELFLMICRVYTFDDYVPSCADFGREELRHIIDYLKMSHRYYSEYVIPRLCNEIDDTVASCDVLHGKVLKRFFDDYRGEVANHFDYEEKTVFPYVEALLNGERPAGYSIESFEDNHSDIDEKLSDMKSIIMKYLPENSLAGQRNEVLFEIYRFEEDLKCHTLIENRMLIPLVAKIEKQL